MALSSGDIEKVLESFPHSFQLTELEKLNMKKRLNILKRLQSEKCLISLCEMDENRSENFISFLLFRINEDITEAHKVNCRVRERDKTNIVAHANHVQFLLKKGDIYEANECLKQLVSSKKSPSYEQSHAEAEAEMAYCLSRMSPQFYFKAVDMFKSVNEKFPNEYLWKYGEALTLRRCVSPNCYTVDPQHDIEANIVRCSKLLQEIIKCSEHDQLCALAWVELGQLYNYLDSKFVLISEDVLKRVKEEVGKKIWEDCFHEAHKICDTNHAVLEQCGKYFRYCGKLNLSKKAIDILPTAFNHHHMALTLKKKAEETVRNKMSKPEQTYRRGQGQAHQRYGNKPTNLRLSDSEHRNYNNQSFKQRWRRQGPPRPQNNGPEPRNNVSTRFERHRYNEHRNYNQSPQHGLGPRGSRADVQQTRNVRCGNREPPNYSDHSFHNQGHSQYRSYSRHPSGNQRHHPRPASRRHDVDPFQASYDGESHVHHGTDQSDHHGAQKQPLQDPCVADGATAAHCSQNLQIHSPTTTADSESSLSSKLGAMSLSEIFLNQEITDNCSPIRYNGSKRLQEYLKSQKPRIQLSKDDQLIEKAIYHLNESVKITNECNVKAVLDLGIIYMQLGDTEKAEESFKMAIQNGVVNGSPLDMVTAYEELGLCYAKIRENSPEQADQLSKKMQLYLTLAIQKAADIVARIPCLQITGYEQRHGFKTISMLLKHKSKAKHNLKEVARLHELVGRYKDSLDFYKEVLKLDSQEAENIEFWMSVINNYLKLDDYSNAATILSLLHCTDQASDVPHDLVYQVYTKKAYYHFQNVQPEQAHYCLQYAFNYKFGTRCEKEDTTFDIMILYDEEDHSMPEVSEDIKSILGKYTGLSITKNIDDGFGGDLDISNYEEIMQSAKVIVVLLGPKATSRAMEQRIAMAITLNAKQQNKTIICVTTKEHHDVLALAMFKHLSAPVNEAAATDKHTDWILQFFSLILDFKLQR